MTFEEKALALVAVIVIGSWIGSVEIRLWALASKVMDSLKNIQKGFDEMKEENDKLIADSKKLVNEDFEDQKIDKTKVN